MSSLRRPRVVLALLPLTLVIGLAACGGGASDSGLARDVLAKRADAICDASVAQSDKIKDPDPTNEKAMVSYLNAFASITHKETAQFKALTPSADAKADWAALIAGQQKIDDLFTTTQKETARGDMAAMMSLSGAAKTADPFVAAATKLGALRCAKD